MVDTNGAAPVPSAVGTQYSRWSGIGVTLLGLYLIASVAILLYALIIIWPSNPNEDVEVVERVFFSIDITQLPKDIRFVVIAALSGALGSYIHIGSSFSRHIGVNSFDWKWAWWYLQHPWIAMALAVIFYFLLRGGLLTASASSDVDIFGLAGICGLVGLSTNQATNKLKEIFDVVLRPAEVGSKKFPYKGSGSTNEENVQGNTEGTK